MNITVLAGGISTERDVSLVSGMGVYKALKEKGYNVVLMDIFLGYEDVPDNIADIFTLDRDFAAEIKSISEDEPEIEAVKALRKDKSNALFGPNVIEICKASDIVFMALHGDCGENGKLQATFDLLGIKYTGTDYASSLVSMDKKTTKALLVANNILTPKEYLINEGNNNINVSKYPVVVKPNIGGSSIGVTIAKDETEFKVSVDNASKYDSQIIVEEYIKGREFSVGILGDNILPAIEIIPKAGCYDYKNKYQSDMTIEVCPANISKNIVNKMN